MLGGNEGGGPIKNICLKESGNYNSPASVWVKPPRSRGAQVKGRVHMDQRLGRKPRAKKRKDSVGRGNRQPSQKSDDTKLKKFPQGLIAWLGGGFCPETIGVKKEKRRWEKKNIGGFSNRH